MKGAHGQLYDAAIVLVEADLSTDVDLVFSIEEAAQEEVVNLLGHIYFLGLLAHGHATEKVDDTCHG